MCVGERVCVCVVLDTRLCVTLHYTALYYTTLYHTILYRTILHYTTLHCTVRRKKKNKAAENRDKTRQKAEHKSRAAEDLAKRVKAAKKAQPVLNGDTTAGAGGDVAAAAGGGGGGGKTPNEGNLTAITPAEEVVVSPTPTKGGKSGVQREQAEFTSRTHWGHTTMMSTRSQGGALRQNEAAQLSVQIKKKLSKSDDSEVDVKIDANVDGKDPTVDVGAKQPKASVSAPQGVRGTVPATPAVTLNESPVVTHGSMPTYQNEGTKAPSPSLSTAKQTSHPRTAVAMEDSSFIVKDVQRTSRELPAEALRMHTALLPGQIPRAERGSAPKLLSDVAEPIQSRDVNATTHSEGAAAAAAAAAAAGGGDDVDDGDGEKEKSQKEKSDAHSSKRESVRRASARVRTKQSEARARDQRRKYTWLTKQCKMVFRRMRAEWAQHGLSKDCTDFITGLLMVSPRDRLGYRGATEVRSHPFLGAIDFKALRGKKLNAPFKPDVFNECNFTEQEPIPREVVRPPPMKPEEVANNPFVNFEYTCPNSLLLELQSNPTYNSIASIDFE
jgi:hypothetical protein